MQRALMVMEFSDPRMLPMPFNLIKRCIALITPVVDVLSRVVHVVRDCLCCRTRYYYSERLMKSLSPTESLKLEQLQKQLHTMRKRAALAEAQAQQLGSVTVATLWWLLFGLD